MKYRKKPVVIDAVLWTGEISDMADFLGDLKVLPKGDALLIPTQEGVMEARKGDYIIRGVRGEFYPCKPDIFMATYEPIQGKL